jgi:SWI/SNF-related matrix-associated actin-dependent regulator of chromatin subfamily A3
MSLLTSELAHIIRTRRTKLFTAITSLDAVHHWCLTGTPISNRIDDLGALLDFCRVPLLGDSKCFQQHVVAVSRKSFRRGCGVLRETLKPLCLRRTRAILEISSPDINEKEITFSKREMEHYRWIMEKGKRAIDAAVSGHAEKGSRNIMLKTLLELRIFCNQGTYTHLGYEKNDRSLDADEHLTLLEEKEEALCACCLSTVTMINQPTDPASGVLGDCSHILCSLCYGEVVIVGGSSSVYKCSFCGETTKPQDLRSYEDSVSGQQASKHSSKLNALVQDLQLSQRSPIPEKR